MARSSRYASSGYYSIKGAKGSRTSKVASETFNASAPISDKRSKIYPGGKGGEEKKKKKEEKEEKGQEKTALGRS